MILQAAGKKLKAVKDVVSLKRSNICDPGLWHQ
jgi:hypothetical protein